MEEHPDRAPEHRTRRSARGSPTHPGAVADLGAELERLRRSSRLGRRWESTAERHRPLPRSWRGSCCASVSTRPATYAAVRPRCRRACVGLLRDTRLAGAPAYVSGASRVGRVVYSAIVNVVVWGLPPVGVGQLIAAGGESYRRACRQGGAVSAGVACLDELPVTPISLTTSACARSCSSGSRTSS